MADRQAKAKQVRNAEHAARYPRRTRKAKKDLRRQMTRRREAAWNRTNLDQPKKAPENHPRDGLAYLHAGEKVIPLAKTTHLHREPPTNQTPPTTP